MSPDETPDAADEDETLYDAYLDAALAGRLEDPAAFVARHPQSGQALRDRITSLHRDLSARRERRAEAAPDVPFERLGEFRLQRRLGEGGMGTVFLAEQESLGRTVALKVIRAELAGSPSAAERFRREASTVARLRHENIVQVHAVGEDRGVRFIAMQFVEGRGLDEILDEAESRGTRIPASDAVRWAARLGRALDVAHRAGIVHRDVKPSNVRITPEGSPTLLDFGIARDLGEAGLTASAPFVGSPHYAAPEQIAGEPGAVGARTDVYSLGVLLYRCLAGRTPWRGESVEQVFREILAVEPPRLKSLVPSIARDLEVVVGKAMEKDPGRRYPSAAEFADDLDALLDFRPVRARPPSHAARLVKWARRSPGPAAALATVAAALVVLAVILVANERAVQQARRDDAAATIALARSRIETYRSRRAESIAIEDAVDRARALVTSMYLEPEQERLLDEQEDAVASFRREREAVYHEVLDLVRRAEETDPAVRDADAVRAELYLEKWREAVDASDPGAAAYFRERLVAADAGGSFAEEVSGEATLSVTTDPPGAEVHVFRYAEQSDVVKGGEHRLVPVPLRGPAGLTPGAWAMDVSESSGRLRRGDLILTLDGKPLRDVGAAAAREAAARGGAVARVVRGGTVTDEELPPGLAVRVTAAPLFVCARSLAGTSPLASMRVEPGSYLVVLRKPDFEDVRLAVAVTRSARSVAVTLVPDGTTPPGFVRIESGGNSGHFWIMQREVTASEYLEFLNDEATRCEIAASPVPIRVPRGLAAIVPSGSWPCDAGGRVGLPANCGPAWPVLGVSLEDARAFAAWRTARAARDGSKWVFAIPSHDEWVTAGLGSGDRRFVYGNRFRPKWASSCFARRQAMPEPVLSYPVDESPAGVFDLTGSAAEWCDSWYDEGRRLHRLGGGSWAQAEPDRMNIWRPCGGAAEFASEETGFRLVIRGTAGPR